eukprot:980208_1
MGNELPSASTFEDMYMDDEQKPLTIQEEMNQNIAVAIDHTINTYQENNYEQLRRNQFTDCWDLSKSHNMQLSNYSSKIIHYEHQNNTLKSPKWVSVFGTKIVCQNEYKRWRIKIVPTNNNNKLRGYGKRVNIFIGICDHLLTGPAYGSNDLFWQYPHFGYGYGNNGKIFHLNKKGESYGLRYKIGDII